MIIFAFPSRVVPFSIAIRVPFQMLDALLIVIEDNFGSTPWEQTFEFNGKDSGDDDGGKIIGPVVGPVTPVIL